MSEINFELLLKLIRKKHLTYVVIADAAQVSRTTLYNVLTGKISPSHYLSVNLIKILGLSLEETAAIFYPNINFKKGSIYEQFTH